MKSERYRISYEYERSYGDGRTYKNKEGIGFKHKENALKKLRDIKENLYSYMCGDNNRMLSLKFITITTEEISLEKEDTFKE